MRYGKEIGFARGFEVLRLLASDWWALSEGEAIDPRARLLAELNIWFDEFRLDAET